jgi:hypothetical protein
VRDTLVDKAIALAVQPTVILLGNGWNPHHAPYLRLAAQ